MSANENKRYVADLESDILLWSTTGVLPENVMAYILYNYYAVYDTVYLLFQ